MHRIRLFFGILSLALLIPNYLQAQKKLKVHKVKWETMIHDFDTLKQYHPTTFRFVFQNISGKELIIDNVRTSCGCTASDWVEGVIESDSSSFIEIEYDTYKSGHFEKVIKVYLRGQRKAEKLRIKGFVIEGERPNLEADY